MHECKATLHELENVWSLDDLYRFLAISEYKFMKAEAERKLMEQKQKAKK